MITPEEAVDQINVRFGSHPRHRALHAKGQTFAGTFTATPEASRLTRAGHMSGQPVDVVVRLSNGGGDPGIPDYAPDVRGCAVAFNLPDGSRTDILAQTIPGLPIRSPDSFIALVRASEPSLAGAIRMPIWIARNPSALAGLRRNIDALRKLPASYATRIYHALHSFRWVGADGDSRHVRYRFLPEGGEENIPAKEAKKGGRDYLRDELNERVASGPVRFDFEAQIAAEGDDVDDPSATWPDDRERVIVGTIELTGRDPASEDILFDPMRLVDGIEPSADPILAYRPGAYSVSYERRAADGRS